MIYYLIAPDDEDSYVVFGGEAKGKCRISYNKDLKEVWDWREGQVADPNTPDVKISKKLAKFLFVGFNKAKKTFDYPESKELFSKIKKDIGIARKKT